MTDPATVISLNTDWLFKGAIDDPLPENWPDDELAARHGDPDLADGTFQRVTLPHTVAPLSWRQWDQTSWQKVWSYRRHFDLPEAKSGRIFLDIEAALTNATVTLNGVNLGRHHGGYLPFSFEITDTVKEGDNVLGVLLDARFNLNVPPNIPIPVASEAVDYWQPGGIYGSVSLRIVPSTFIRDIVTTTSDVLDPAKRSLAVTCTIDSLSPVTEETLEVRLLDASGDPVGEASTHVVEQGSGEHEVTVHIGSLDAVELWDVENPVLYTVDARLTVGAQTHARTARIGFREARFELDGFYLNGRRLYLFGANRHQHYPYAGFAMPERVQRRDAELLKNELNCVMVRCSHYPQLAGFLDACDELGLLVWEESPGWQYVGDDEWRNRAADDIRSMILRDRNRPSIIIWGARLNETPDHPEFYAETEAMVKALDSSRATSGTTFGPYYSTKNFKHDVFSYDDYSIVTLPDGDLRPTLRPPRGDFPYLVAEAVTSWSSPARLYRRAHDALVQQHQAMDHAHVHDIARGDHRYAGILVWSAIDYQAGHVVNYQGVKTSGMLDTFRIPKPGAAMYRSQVDASQRVVLEPAFTWDPPVARQRGAHSDNRRMPASWGPGERAVIFSNCDRVEVSVGGEVVANITPDRQSFPNLVTPPSFVDLRMTGAESPDLRLDGFIGDELVISRQFSGDRSTDHLVISADDAELRADGVDTTRVWFAIADRFNEARGHSQARLIVEADGPAVLIGESPFDLEPTGAVGAVWVRTLASEAGLITARVSHPVYGSDSVSIRSYV